jgi:hypothetical protein
MKILFNYRAESRIKECKITADNDHQEQNLMKARDKNIELLGLSATTDVVNEGSDSGNDQNDPERTSGLFTIGGCENFRLFICS